MVADEDLYTVFAIENQLQHFDCKCDIVNSAQMLMNQIEQRFNATGTTYQLVISNLLLTKLKGTVLTQAILSYLQA